MTRGDPSLDFLKIDINTRQHIGGVSGKSVSVLSAGARMLVPMESKLSRRDLRLSGIAAGWVPDLLSLRDAYTTYFQILPELLVPCPPEGFRKCFRKGGSSWGGSLQHSHAGCLKWESQASFRKVRRLARSPTMQVDRRQVDSTASPHAHLVFRRQAGILPLQVLPFPGTRPQQEQIPPQRKFSGRLDVNNSRVRGWNTWRGA